MFDAAIVEGPDSILKRSSKLGFDTQNLCMLMSKENRIYMYSIHFTRDLSTFSGAYLMKLTR